jgi:hypothetical protein
MTDFEKWYALHDPNLDPEMDDLFVTIQHAYEAGAASQAGTLRDEFAGKALMGMMSGNITCEGGWVADSFKFADAMLEARKTTGDSEA